jgi:hypothetical protein
MNSNARERGIALDLARSAAVALFSIGEEPVLRTYDEDALGTRMDRTSSTSLVIPKTTALGFGGLLSKEPKGPGTRVASKSPWHRAAYRRKAG